MSDVIKKAKHQVGDIHPNGKWVWTKLKSGKEDWRAIKQPKAGATAASSPAAASKTTATPVKGAQNLEQWAARTSYDNLLKVVNNPKGNAQLRKIAYDEIKNRPEFDASAVDTSGTLSTLLKMTGGSGQDAVAGAAATAKVDVNDGEGGNADGEITEDWFLNQRDPRVQKQFNRLQNKSDRIAYDRFVYKMKKKSPDYQSPVEVMQDLNADYLSFLDNDEQRFMISAGGAGIGKSYGFKKIAELLNKKPFDPETDAPGDEDYDYVELGDINSKKQLLDALKAHNGKILLFDDTDSVITRKDLASVMKKATAMTGKRVVGDPDDTKTNFTFTGRIMIMTNKDLTQLAENEDTKAILSRAGMVSSIYMTVDETIEILKDRFQSMDFPQTPHLADDAEDKAEREELFKLIVDNKDKIDPAEFTTRTFGRILNDKRNTEKRNKFMSQGGDWTSLLGSKAKDWEKKALKTLTKAADVVALNYDYDPSVPNDNEIIKAEQLFEEDIMEKADFTEKERKSLAKKKEALPDGSFPIRNTSDLKNAIRLAGNAKNPERARRWIKKRAKSLGAESMIPDTWKAQEAAPLQEVEMSIEKAETLLFGDE